MSAQDTGGPAYSRPASTLTDPGGLVLFDRGDRGMTLLDYFAGQFLASYTSNDCMKAGSPKVVAAQCYEQAEAMITRKRKREEQA